MRRLLACCALGLLLLAPACASSPRPEQATPAATPDLGAEGDRLSAELSGSGAVATADVRLRSGATWGRQVLIEATTASTDTAEQRAALETITRAGWNTTAFVPTDVSASLVGPAGTVLDARDLGFPHRGADPAGLFALFGPPAADEGWRP